MHLKPLFCMHKLKYSRVHFTHGTSLLLLSHAFLFGLPSKSVFFYHTKKKKEEAKKGRAKKIGPKDQKGKEKKPRKEKEIGTNGTIFL